MRYYYFKLWSLLSAAVRRENMIRVPTKDLWPLAKAHPGVDPELVQNADMDVPVLVKCDARRRIVAIVDGVHRVHHARRSGDKYPYIMCIAVPEKFLRASRI